MLLDHGYQPETIRTALQQLYPQVLKKVRFQLALKLALAEKAAQGKAGLVPRDAMGYRAVECLDGTV